MSVLTGEVVGGELQFALRRTWLHLGLGVGQVPGLARRRRPEAEAATCNTHQNQETVPRRQSVSCNEDIRGVCAGWGWVGELSRGESLFGRGGVEVSFGMAVWRYGGTSLTHSPCRRTPFARAALGFTTRGLTQYILLKLPFLRCLPPCAPLRSRFAFLAILMMDGSRAISLSPEKRPPRISSGYFHTEMFKAAKSGTSITA